jgi:4-hydroxy-tetrahydrodipicolinate synthase
MVELTHYMLEGKIQQAREVHNTLWPLFKNCFIESNPIPVKSGLWSMGLIENELRLPLVPASEKTQTIMAETVKNLGF